MKKALWPAALAALILAAACANGAGGETAAQARQCDISAQNRSINQALERAAQPGQSVASVVASRRSEIAALAAAAAAGGRAQVQTPREVSCRAIALRAYGALLNSPEASDRDAAWTAISPLADEGHAACDILASRGAMDSGASADCDIIDMWHVTGPALRAGRALQAVRARDNLAPVSDATWSEVAALTREAASAMRSWANAPAVRAAQNRPIVEEHRRRVICHAFAPLAQMRNLSGAGTSAWQQVYVTDYPAMMAAAAAAAPFPPSPIDQAHAIETFCSQHAVG